MHFGSRPRRDEHAPRLALVADRLVLWDFDGTLAMRPGLWSGCVIEVLDEQEPGHGIVRERIRAALRDGFPWHVAHEAHPHLSDPERWWEPVEDLLARAIASAGFTAGRSAELSRAVRMRFIDGAVGWRLYPDTLPALQRVTRAGWLSAILSNHVPELPELARRLGLGELVEQVFTSATIGFEKPHPEAFRHALSACGEPARRWMVGDNLVADIGGAQALGIPAILVRSEGAAPLRAEDLAGAVDLILEADANVCSQS
jgi:putative hydrolase of the HAD superfamily